MQFRSKYWIAPLSISIFTASSPSISQVSTPYYYGTLYIYSINSNDYIFREKTYYIESSMPNVPTGDLEFKKASKYVENALSPKGYSRVARKEDASILIRLAFGAGSPQTTATTYQTSSGYSYPIGSWWYTVQPTYQTVQKNYYTTTVIIEAYDLKSQNEIHQIWKTTFSATGEWGTTPNTSNLIIVIPDMIAAAAPYIGTNTKKAEVPLCSGCPSVIEIMKD